MSFNFIHSFVLSVISMESSLHSVTNPLNPPPVFKIPKTSCWYNLHGWLSHSVVVLHSFLIELEGVVEGVESGSGFWDFVGSKGAVVSEGDLGSSDVVFFSSEGVLGVEVDPEE